MNSSYDEIIECLANRIHHLLKWCRSIDSFVFHAFFCGEFFLFFLPFFLRVLRASVFNLLLYIPRLRSGLRFCSSLTRRVTILSFAYAAGYDFSGL